MQKCGPIWNSTDCCEDGHVNLFGWVLVAIDDTEDETWWQWYTKSVMTKQWKGKDNSARERDKC